MSCLYFLDIDPQETRIPEEMFLSLPVDRRDRLLRYRRDLDRRIGACSDILIRCLVCARLGRRFGEVAFLTGPYGKPYLEGHPVEFSVSHTRCAVAAVLSDGPVGVDVERVRQIDPGTAGGVFSASELAYLNDGPGDRMTRFFEIWTKKEARLKRRGTGLTGDLKSCDITRVEPGETFSTLRAGDYVISVCAPYDIQHSDLKRIGEADLAGLWRRYT